MTRFGRRALGPALVLLAQQAAAVALGDIEVRSALGEPLAARIPLTLLEGEAIDASCFTLARAGGNETMPQLVEGTLTIDTVSVPPALRVRTAARLFEPALAVRVRAACAGDSPVERQYVLLLDPRPGTAGVEALPSVAATLSSRPGDSLRSLAVKIFPRERAARAQYLEALREMNPSLASTPSGAALPEGSAVALPDLRTFAKARPRRQAPPPGEPGAAAELAQPPAAAPKGTAPKPFAAPKDAAPPRAATPKQVTAPKEPLAPAQALPPKAAAQAVSQPPARAVLPPRSAAKAPPAAPAGSAFVLKLSSAEVDMSRSRGIDDRKRAQLRERQLVLDSDDQVAALLSLRNSLKQLEARVADLQLKLAGMPASLAARADAASAQQPPQKAAPPVPARLEQPKPTPRIEAPNLGPAIAEPPTAAPAMVAAPRIEAAKAEPPPAPAPAAAPAPAVVAPSPTPAAEAPKATAPQPAPPAVTPAKEPAPPKAAAAFDWAGLAANPLLWAAILALAAAVLGLVAWRRRTDARADEDALPDEATMTAERAFDDEARLIPPRDTRTDRPAMASDTGLSTRLPDNSRELRRRYIEERFPEIANRTLALEDAASIVKGARLFYEDGALPRAVELLQFAIEDRPAEVRTWLALFEIFRLERLSGEFAELARRFHAQHGNTEYWRKVQYFGREIDPANPLYKEDTINTLETIGPREARRLATAGAAVDPIAENWLDAPMDFENEVLANELRQSLMTVAGLTEPDLIPNPMPALRSIEMFTVA